MPVDHGALAQQLFDARATRDPIAFLSGTHDIDEKAGYAIQHLLIRKLLAATEARVAGYKISLTSAATQRIADTDEPAYGTLLSSDIMRSGASICLGNMFKPLIETEVVFVLHEDLSSDPSVDEVLANATIAPAIEVPDGRYVDWFPNFTLGDLLADDAATGRVVVGKEAATPTYADLAAIGVRLTLDGAQLAMGKADCVMGNPVDAIRWLARKLATHGKWLRKGQIVTSGTLVAPVVVARGTYVANFSSLGVAEVTFTN